jgi:hypothetical protein
VALAALLVPSTLRRCPICGAEAIAAVTRTDADRRAWCEVRCGGCGTWRAVEGRRRHVAALERRMQAVVRHDCHRMALAFRRAWDDEPALVPDELRAVR